MIQRKAGRCPKSCVATFGPTPGPLLAHRSSASADHCVIPKKTKKIIALTF